MVVSDAKIVEQRQECVHQRRVAAVDGQVLNEDSGLLGLPSAHRGNHAVGARTAAAAPWRRSNICRLNRDVATRPCLKRDVTAIRHGVAGTAFT